MISSSYLPDRCACSSRVGSSMRRSLDPESASRGAARKRSFTLKVAVNERRSESPYRPSFSFSAILLLLVAFVGSEGNKEASLTGLTGGSTQLPCDVDKEYCGDVYFITWTKNVSGEWKRIYIYSDTVEKPLQELANPDRADFFLEEKRAYLKISPLKLEDEGIYKCDVTYVQGKCPSLSYANLNTIATPGLPVIKKDGVNIQNASTVGPFYEGVSLSFDCYSVGGKPAPEISWWKGDEPLEGKTVSTLDKSGTTDVFTSISLSLTRMDVGKKLQCRVSNEATETPLLSWVEFDVHVAPSLLEVTAPSTPVVASNKVEIKCVIEGAKPAANATWYNVSEIINPQPVSKAEVMPDGTFRTTSTLELTVSRFDNKVNFYCKGTNFVLESRGAPPLLKSATLEVLYPPVVTLQPIGGILINETDSISLSCTYDSNPPNVSFVVWYRGKQALPVEESFGHYTVTYDDFPKLSIKNISRSEHGLYSCSLRNAAGRGNSTNRVEVNVLYPPVVQATVSPSIVNEGEFGAVSLFCDILSGNPQNLLRVRWYKDGELTNETTEKEIAWLNVSRNFTGRYFCQGENAAGWGSKSDPTDLVVNYAPSKASLLHLNPQAIKGSSAYLKCQVSNPGFPPATLYRWELDGQLLRDIVEDNYTIDQLALRSRGNYSCAAVNAVGTGTEAIFNLDVKAPPAFVEKLPSVFGAAADANRISVSCRVECDPLCGVEWLKDGESLRDSDLYYEKTNRMPEDEAGGLFESVVSTLYWNMTAWPGEEMSREHDNANYTCRSTANSVGPSVSFTMKFTVEYGPENISLTSYRIDVLEGEAPEKIRCTASSWPPSEYYWKYSDDVISSQSTLFLNYSIPRHKSGIYTCVAKNRHGQAKAEAAINVLYKPVCNIYESRNENDESALICEIRANPSDVNFHWVKDNETLSEDDPRIERLGSKSILTLTWSEDEPESQSYYGIYYCLANNSVGMSSLCRIELEEPTGPAWIATISDENVIIIACAVAGVVLLFIIIIIIIILIMRRKRLNNSSSPAKMSSGEPLYQNISLDDKKGGNGPPVAEVDNRTMYENMPFHFGQRDQKGPYKPDVSDEMLYADMYEDVKTGKVPDPRMRPPLPPKGLGKQPKEPPLPPKTKRKKSQN